MDEMQFEDYQAFGDMLVLYRRHKKIRSSEFAKKHGISRATLWRIEAGKSKDIPISLHNEILSTARQEAKAERTEEIQDKLFDLIQTHDCDKGKECGFVDRLIKTLDSLTSKGGV